MGNVLHIDIAFIVKQAGIKAIEIVFSFTQTVLFYNSKPDRELLFVQLIQCVLIFF